MGTVIARMVEFLLCLLYSLRCDVRLRVKYILDKAGILSQDFIKISLPSIGNDVIWSLATAVFTVILGHMGDEIVAANAVAVMVVNIGAIAMRGFANATTIVIGQTLGANIILAIVPPGCMNYAGRLQMPRFSHLRLGLHLLVR